MVGAMATVTLSVPEIHCGHCKASIESAVRPLDGVTSATVDVDSRTVDVDFDPPASLDEIRAAIVDAGFDVDD